MAVHGSGREHVLNERDQDLLDRVALPGVTEHGGDVRVEVQRDAMKPILSRRTHGKRNAALSTMAHVLWA